ncbi:MAG: thioredoxin domain-containing protein [Candidatus Kuenenbacteria bacterium]
MTKSSITTFITISIILLVGVFFVFMIAGFLAGQPNTNLVQPSEEKVEDNLQRKDPLITSAEDIYLSFVKQDDPIRGDAMAKLVILEFGDFECAYCLQIQESLINILADFEGQVKFVWKDFPNPSHLQARIAALAARCADEQGKFWEFHDYLFTNQDELSRELYNKIALELDLDLKQFNSCLDSQKYIEKVGQGLVDGQKLGVDATPYLFIGNSIVDFAASEEELKGVIRGELGQ